jgi:5-carboxymethyl-2-hydroxymuconate isomerase
MAMSPARPERAGVLVVRVWLEADSGQPRARIIARIDIADGRETIRTASSVDEVCALVREWMTEFLAGRPAP